MELPSFGVEVNSGELRSRPFNGSNAVKTICSRSSVRSLITPRVDGDRAQRNFAVLACGQDELRYFPVDGDAHDLKGSSLS